MCDHLIAGELSLDELIKPVRGILPMTMLAREKNIGNMIVPSDNGREASIVRNITVLEADHLLEIFHYLKGNAALKRFKGGDNGEDGPRIPKTSTFPI